jgi:hypothetical protein
VGKYGTDYTGFGSFEGGINSEQGANLIATNSDGETSLLFGPAALREIQAGVANGDFAIPPDDAEATITEENSLPYWTFTDVNSDGAITAAIVEDAGAASGNVLRFTVASGTLTGKSATLTRFIPVASSASRSFSFYAEATFDSGTNSTQSEVQMTGDFYTSDQTTITGSPISSDNYAFNAFSLGPTGITAPDLYGVAPDLTTMTAPSDAAYLKLTITISTVATQSADRTVDLTEVRLTHGLPELLITDRDDPSNPPAIINAAANELNMQSGSGDYLLIRPDTILSATTSMSLQTSGSATLSGSPVNITSGSTVEVSGRLDSNSGIANTGTITSTGNITGNRFYPGNQATRYIEDNGTYLRAINDFWAVGSLFQSSSGVRVPVIRVGSTSAASTSIPASGSLTVSVTFPALPATPNFAVLGIRWTGLDQNATVVVSSYTSTTAVAARLYNQTGTAITSSRTITYVVGAEN